MTEVIERDATLAPVKRDMPPRPKAPRLLDQVRERICVLHYSRSTEKTYLYWIKFFIHFHGLRHPRDMGAVEVEAFLSHLATAREVSTELPGGSWFVDCADATTPGGVCSAVASAFQVALDRADPVRQLGRAFAEAIAVLIADARDNADPALLVALAERIDLHMARRR